MQKASSRTPIRNLSFRRMDSTYRDIPIYGLRLDGQVPMQMRFRMDANKTVVPISDASSPARREIGAPQYAISSSWLPRGRLMHVAAITAVRCHRERFCDDPMEWLLSEKRFLDHRAPIDACASFEGYRRAMVLHSLDLGFDIEPDCLSKIPLEEVDDTSLTRRLLMLPAHRSCRHDFDTGAPPALYSSYISALNDNGHIQIFSAMIARSTMEVRSRLKNRFGPFLEDHAKVKLGFDPSEPIACALVSDATAQILSLVDSDPTGELASGFDFVVEQRFVD